MLVSPFYKQLDSMDCGSSCLRTDALIMEPVAGVMDGILIIWITLNIRKGSSNYLTLFLYEHNLCPYISNIKP